MKLKKILAMVLCLALCATALTSCGKKKKKDKDESSSQVEESSVVEESESDIYATNEYDEDLDGELTDHDLVLLDIYDSNCEIIDKGIRECYDINWNAKLQAHKAEIAAEQATIDAAPGEDMDDAPNTFALEDKGELGEFVDGEISWITARISVKFEEEYPDVMIANVLSVECLDDNLITLVVSDDDDTRYTVEYQMDTYEVSITDV